METQTPPLSAPPAQQPLTTHPPQKTNSGVLIGIFLLLLGILVGLALNKTTILSGLRIPYLSVKPTPAPTPFESPPLYPTADWKTYTDTKYKFLFKYPAEWMIKTQEYDGSTSKIIFLDKKDIPIPTENVHAFLGLINIQVQHHNLDAGYFKKSGHEQGALVNIGAEEIPAYRTEEITTQNDPRRNMQNVHYVGYSFDYKNEWLYILSIQSDNTDYQQNNSIFTHILSTFTFSEPPTTYTCPANGWVDCMPGTTVKPECSAAAMTWYQAHCPDFKGGAL